MPISTFFLTSFLMCYVRDTKWSHGESMLLQELNLASCLVCSAARERHAYATRELYSKE